MEVTQILHMNKGDGETSYAQNSKVQVWFHEAYSWNMRPHTSIAVDEKKIDITCKILSTAKPIIEEAVHEILCSNIPIESMGIADLGCSSGPNTLLLISEIMDIIHAKRCSGGRHLPPSTATEFRVFLNDLFSNDFNTIFMSLPQFYNKLKQEKGAELFGSFFISGVPGSFYGRLFPAKSLHFVHSSSSLHWLSEVPPGLDSQAAGKALNKGKIYISKSSPKGVLDAYSLQFHHDFSIFLESRAQEIVLGGRMVLSLIGRPSSDPTTPESCYQWELLARALMSMVSEGLIEEEKVDSFNAPYYAPCEEELKLEIQKEGSFIMDHIEGFDIDWDGGADDDFVTSDALASGRKVAKTIRAVVESMIESHFGKDIMDELFQRYAELIGNHLSKSKTKYLNLVISVIKK